MSGLDRIQREGSMGKKILVVDDAMFMRVQLRNILSAEGYVISEATNGQEAVQMSESIDPDLIFMDLTMPVMDGITAIKAIIQAKPGTKIVVCSALGLPNMVMEAVQAGARDFIVKPFQPARVVSSAQQQLGVARA